MTDRNKDVELAIATTASGSEGVVKLKDTVDDLGKSAGELAPEFDRIGKELDSIAAQTKAVEGLKKLQTQVDATAVALTDASAKAERLGVALAEQQATTGGFAERVKDLRTQLEATDQSVLDADAALKRYRASAIGAETATDEYKSRIRELRSDLAEARIQQAAQSSELERAEKALKSSNKELKDSQSAYDAAARGVNTLNTALTAQSTKVEQALSGVKALGVESTDLATASDFVKTALGKTSAALVELVSTQNSAKASTESLEETYRQLAIGIDLVDEAIRGNVAAQKAAEDAANKRFQTATRLLEAELQLEREIASESASIAAKATAQRTADTTALIQSVRQQAAAASQALNDAFGSTGVRSIDAIKGDINEVNEALVTLARRADVSAADFDRAFLGAQQRLTALHGELTQIPGEIQKTGVATEFLKNQFAQLAAIYGGIELASKFFDANIQIETLRRSLTFVTGSASEAARQIQFLRDTANNAGIAVGGVTQSFINFQTSMTKSGQAASTASSIFEGLASASGTLGLSTDKVNLILTALSQIANKGKVSLEELQGQLGESLPGALKISADSLGLTTAELTKLIESGDLLASEFLPAFANGLKNAFVGGESQAASFGQAVNRLKNALTEFAQQAADTTAFKLLTSAIDGLAKNFDVVSSAASGLIKTFIAFKALDFAREFLGIGSAATAAAAAKQRLTIATEGVAAASAVEATAKARSTLAITADTVATEANTVAKAGSVGVLGALQTGYGNAATTVTGLTSRIGSLVGALGGPYGTALTVAIGFSDQLGNGLAKLAARFTGVLGTIEENEKKLKALDDAQAESVKRADEAGASYTKLSVVYTKLSDAAEKSFKVAVKLADAKKVEGDAAIKLAELYGDETLARNVASRAADGNVEAGRKVAAAAQEELSILERRRVSLIAAAGGFERLNEAQKEQIKKLDESIEKIGAEATLRKNRVAELKNEADAAFIAAQSTKDQSGRIDELREARTKAAAQLEKYTTLEREGLVVGTDLVSMRRDLIAAERLYKDALADATRAADLRARSAAVDATISKTNTGLKLQEAQANEKVAESIGDERGVLLAKIEQKSIEIQQTKDAAKSKIAEANTTIEFLRSQKAEITGTDDLSVSKRAEIDLRIKAEQAKIKEAAGSASVVKGLEAELRALQNRNNFASGIGSTGPGGGFGAGGAIVGVNTPAVSTLGPTGSLGKNADGSVATATGQAVPPDNSGLWTYTLDSGKYTQRGFDAQGRLLPGGWYRTAAQFAAFNASGAQGVGTNPFGGTAGTSVVRPASANLVPTSSGSGAGATYVTNVDLGGTLYSINTADQQSADALLALLTAAKQSSGR